MKIQWLIFLVFFAGSCHGQLSPKTDLDVRGTVSEPLHGPNCAAWVAFRFEGEATPEKLEAGIAGIKAPAGAETAIRSRAIAAAMSGEAGSGKMSRAAAIRGNGLPTEHFVNYYEGCEESPPDGFVDIEQAIPGIEVELRYHGADNFVGERIDGYESDVCYITAEAAEALAAVQQELAAFGLGVKVFDAYRPQRAVDHFVRWAEDLDDTKMKAKYYPDVAKEHLFRDGYIAAKSGHSRGSTVDLTIVSQSEDGPRELDMGTGWDYFGPKSWPSSQAVTPQQRANRMLLQSLMVKHGFRPLAEEWWHFTLENEPFPETYFDFEVR